MVSLPRSFHHSNGARAAPEHPVAASESTGRSRDRWDRIQPRGRSGSIGIEEGVHAAGVGWEPRDDDGARREVLEALGSGDHLGVLLPNGPADPDWLVPLVRRGLESGERVLVLSGSWAVEQILERLRHAGIEEERFVRAGGLMVIPAEEIFLRNGEFDPSLALAFVDAEIELAKAVGYGGLRIVTDMGWALDRIADWSVVYEYEKKLHALVRGRPCLVVCHYDERLLRRRTLPGFLCCHPRWLGHLERESTTTGRYDRPLRSPEPPPFASPLPSPVNGFHIRRRPSAPTRSTGREKRNP